MYLINLIFGNRQKSCIFLILRTNPLKCLEKVATGNFVNLPITYKSRKSNFKISKNLKMSETKKLRLNTFN